MTLTGLSVTLVRACLRAGAGGSPTAVVDEAGLSDGERRRVPVESGTSHAVFLAADPAGREGAGGSPSVSLRFFTAEGELPACGHGTVAALAVLAARAGSTRHRFELRTHDRSFTGRWVREGGRGTAAFDPGPVNLREPAADEAESVADALKLAPTPTGSGPVIASVGRPRLLVPVASRAALAALAPDLDRLRAACDRWGLLGAYVHSPPDAEGRLAARMFAPSIGVPEDIANANSTACLAAHLAGRGRTRIAVDMGDALGSPATITATATGPVPRVLVGGAAELTGTRTLS
ncbi:PhzF family phenazine biosynthesis protein [Streptomyces sp. NPDC020917]|uniref:PhzF family phenazine biosynthesis protein n=1 Tax=Streptomyces sp. NPDC020917 TaxID=3365102 RepID=UPI00379787C7